MYSVTCDKGFSHFGNYYAELVKEDRYYIVFKSKWDNGTRLYTRKFYFSTYSAAKAYYDYVLC